MFRASSCLDDGVVFLGVIVYALVMSKFVTANRVVEEVAVA